MAIDALMGLVTGVIGVTLSIVNSVIIISDRNFKIKLQFKASFLTAEKKILIAPYPFINSNERLKEVAQTELIIFPCIEIINLSRNPIAIDEVGVRANMKIGNRQLFNINHTTPNTERPYKIESHNSLYLYVTGYDIRDLPIDTQYVYAITSFGKTFFRKLKNFKEEISYLKRHK